MSETVAIKDVVYDEGVYPRFAIDEDSVKRYRDAIDDLPAIVLSADGRIVDGYHRYRAHQVEGRTTINAERLDIEDDDEIYAEACRRNATHGKQLTYDEKRKAAREIYRRDGFDQSDVADILACSTGFVSGATKNIRTKEREERREKAYRLYLNYVDYPTQADVAEELDVTRPTVKSDVKKFTDEEICIAPDQPEYTNHWQFDLVDDSYGEDYPGRIPGQIIENLLYLYTEPFDLVVDPMAGGATTVDVCEAMARRYAAFDINPRADKHVNYADVTEQWPLDQSVAQLVFLDPPYHDLMRDDYVDGSVAHQSIGGWYDDMVHAIDEASRVTKPGGYVAFLMMSHADIDQDGEAIDRRFDDHTFEVVRRVADANLSLEARQRYSVPNSHGSLDPQAINHAQEHRYCLDVNRDLVVFEVV